MTKTTTQRIAIVTALALLAPMAATAEQKQRPPRPDLGKMAAQLNVSEAALKTCMPAPTKGERPARPDAQKIAGCLKGDNPQLTTADVDQALKANGPKGQRKS
ncbi:hypothetical protein [Sulfitobacter donghicola]|uniref:Uncharacterized protein n=1 Tax=Sulfitobacter donghicola DSW-25 = KCTC 12864 = JCM 14565 TaxID=1300350 RepID=A0A073IEF7_9RHOB|nr:hypothetical protein [Sulfitobacter donghicola]KEJ88109.1 hypothetical protein DSW25_17345 [Sulfitobacter donghicola DSW-25 = KCTC 12864 = JCM 14565]KIN68749.1 hypothetical protein Z948_2480 [Sulfitobacter donghicola DSW-25 = KCTC 12864 = JCM 14565]